MAMASASPSISPPRTPVDPRTAAATNAARKVVTPPSDDSYIEDLSFDYVVDDNGNIHRISKGSSKSSPQAYTPPTPPNDAIETKEFKKPPSPISLNSPVVRSSLSRSESAYPVLETTSGTTSEKLDRPARSFSRVASGPLLSAAPSHAAPTTSSTSKSRTVPRRVTLDEASEKTEGVPISSRSRQTLDSHSHPYQDDKENISESDENQIAASGKRRLSPPLAARSSARPALRTTYSSTGGTRPLIDIPRATHARQVAPVPNRAGRMLKSTSVSAPKLSGSALHETDTSENEYGPSPISAPGNYGKRNSLNGAIQSGAESDIGEDGEVDPTNVAVPSSATSSMFGRQKSQLFPGGAAVASSLKQSTSNRPRRSASFSDALAHDDYQLQVQQQYMSEHSRPGTSLGMNAIPENPDASRRVTGRGKVQQAEILSDCEKYIGENEPEHRDNELQPRQSPSPTHVNIHQARLAHGHRRHDSDTLRSVVPSSVGSPTAVDPLSRVPSRSGQGRASPSSVRASQERVSPPSTRLQARVSPKGRISPSSAKERLSPPSNRPGPPTGKERAGHRRSPTAPDPSTVNDMVGAGSPMASSGQTWAASEREDEYQSERERERRPQAQAVERPSPPSMAYTTQPIPPASTAPAPTQSGLTQSGQPPPPPMQSPRHIVVNKKPYARLDMIGKGGSSRVFRVMSHNNELYAIKRVSLDRTDNEMMSGYMNEIALLKRLEGNSRIIRLIDSEVRAGPGGSKGHLLLVMECGEIDLARLLQDQMKHPLNMVWVAYYWQQMLQAVHVIHEEKIVHSDLKPANFVLVRGQLKLIDFGIANAIANDTTNIQRDHQVGTINYMSPEAIELPDGMRRLKVGRPSDVWSLGVILYQMVYGQPPFQHLPFIQKMRAIPDHNHVIEFPEYSVPTVPASKSPNGDQLSPPTKLDHLRQRVRSDVVDSMKKCLTRSSKERAMIPELLEHNWLSMKESELNAPPKPQVAADETIINPYYMRQLLQYGIKLGATQGETMDQDALLREAERLVMELKGLQP